MHTINFRCDRCSYRCARSSSLKRHLATHLNAAMPQPQQPQQPPPTVQPPTSNSVVIEDSKFTTHLPIATPMPPVVTVVSHPTQQQQQQQQIPSHLNQLVPHIQQHPQLQQEQNHEPHQYDPNALNYRSMNMKFA